MSEKETNLNARALKTWSESDTDKDKLADFTPSEKREHNIEEEDGREREKESESAGLGQEKRTREMRMGKKHRRMVFDGKLTDSRGGPHVSTGEMVKRRVALFTIQISWGIPLYPVPIRGREREINRVDLYAIDCEKKGKMNNRKGKMLALIPVLSPPI